MKQNIQKIITISILTSSLLMGTTIQEINQDAITLLKENKSDVAYEILINEYKNNTYDNQTLFLLGTISKQNGDYDSAIKYFEELLQKDSAAMRVRLELAVMYYKKQNLKKAKELLLIVKASNPPAKVGDNINNFLAAIEKGVPKSYSINVDIGYLYDTNVNAGPSTDTVLMYNLPFTLSEDAKQTKDHAKRFNVGINHRKTFENFILQSSATIAITDYNKVDTLDTQSLSISSGPSWQIDKQTNFSIPFIFNVTKIGHKDRYYSISKGISPQINYQYTQSLSFGASLSLAHKDYYKNSDKRSNSYTFSPFSRYFLDQSSWISLGGYYGRENSKTKTSANRSKGINLSYFKAFNQYINLNISSSYSKTSYDEKEAAYDVIRDDNSRTIAATFSYYIPQIKSNLSLNTSYTKNRSNIDMYKYKRKQIGINLSYRF
jgi:tetratricopeptide (TPR) repeat protein